MCKRVAPAKISLVTTRFVREEVSEYAGPRVFSLPEDVAKAVNILFDLEHQTQEHFVAIGLTTKNTLISAWLVSVGSVSASIVHPVNVFGRAVEENCSSVIVAHNHPSGDPTPSGADIQLVKRLMKAGDVLGVELLDSIIVGSGRYISMRDEGLM